jgi:hypothetical protein
MFIKMYYFDKPVEAGVKSISAASDFVSEESDI